MEENKTLTTEDLLTIWLNNNRIEIQGFVSEQMKAKELTIEAAILTYIDECRSNLVGLFLNTYGRGLIYRIKDFIEGHKS